MSNRKVPCGVCFTPSLCEGRVLCGLDAARRDNDGPGSVDAEGYIECPYCGDEQWDDLNYSDGEYRVECESESCARTFTVRVATTVTFTSIPEDRPNGR